MGFYIDLKKASANGLEFREAGTPQVFWMLFALLGFALSCMGLAAYHLLGTLLKTGDILDLLLVGAILSALPFYLIIGIKLVWVRKFVCFETTFLKLGFTLGKFPIFVKRVCKADIEDVQLINQRPAPNVAPIQHDDSQYFIRGHWRVLVKLKNGKNLTLDRHTEKGALHPLLSNVRTWLNS